jgi:uroporphyrin-III C-methyltransferase/precorrin-2 dehydrogenase/sirohydrochlorin ferrochelatase/uroporphyrin-III C-methyltransferase
MTQHLTTHPLVYLVGAGPGDPDLLTVKAARLIREAEVVVYDRLVGDPILALIEPGTPRIYAGKATGQHALAQEEINELLVSLVRSNRTVVRLKGGDPFVFGRGGEEAQFLARNGISFEIVPGVSAGNACAAYAGIPLTHRGVANSVQFITGHCREDRPLDLDWTQLADAATTLVVYMGLAQISLIAAGLTGAGRAPSTPLAIVESGTTPQHRTILTTLGAAAADVKRHAIESPATIIVGEVATLARELDWFDPQSAEDAAPPQDRFASSRA